jgi:serine/threonine protein kinase
MEFFADSPLVAKLIGFCKEPVCLVMKYYHHGSLDAWYMSVQPSKAVKLAILKDVSKAIAILHERQVAHCDLKPQNILVDEVEQKLCFLLTDFGISKILTAEYLASEAFYIRNLRGLTVSYAAPDVLQRFRDKKKVTKEEAEKSGDVYSLGVVKFFVLTRTLPW